ncbi:MAG: T9SS type A sorting domain-containing protein [Flavipsychrobacter sp.]|nr:T9SS type A sorting domain-containing protein [Flavipsychrobacter sp.]
MSRKLLFLIVLALATTGIARGQLSGVYTINSASATAGTNFASFTDAATALAGGVTGPVTLNVHPGTYSGQVIFPAVTGTSATNTITINGNGDTLSFAGTSTNCAGITLNGTNHMTINNLVVNGYSGTSNSWGILLTAGATYDTIRNSTIKMFDSVSSSSIAGIVISGSPTVALTEGNNGANNTILNNTVYGGYYGILVYGSSTTTYNTGNIISGNTIKDYYNYGIYTALDSSLTVTGNDISRPTRSQVPASGGTSSYGIYSGSNNASFITKNKVHNLFDVQASNSFNGSTCYGIAVNQKVTTPTITTLVENNAVFNINNYSSNLIAMQNASTGSVNFYHNTISLTDNTVSTGCYSRGILISAAGSASIIKNNIINITRSGTAASSAIYRSTSATLYPTTDYNDYYMATAGTNNLYTDGSTGYTSLAGWQAASPAQDAHSKNINPAFTLPAPNNLIPTVNTIDNMGTPVGTLTDITNSLRSTTHPDAGAYEFTVSNGVTLSGPNVVCIGATAALTGTPSGGTYSYSYGSGSTVVASVDSTTGVVTGLVAGTVTISYTTASGSANYTMSVNPIPTVAPITGNGPICPGGTITLANTTSGGSWTTSNATVAGVAASSGVVTGGTAGNATVTYTVTTNGCTNNSTVTVTVGTAINPVISGTLALCAGGSTALSALPTGGTWSSGTTSTATINSTSGLVNGVAAGTSVITYNNGSATCPASSTATVTVNALPAAPVVTGSTNICMGAADTLHSITTGGVWTSATPLVATIGGATGIITTVAPGTSIMTYTITSGSCSNSASTTITVNALPVVPVITGASSICLGAIDTLKSVSTGGVWTSATATVVTIDATSGIIVTVAPGTSIITYTVASGTCTSNATATITVNALPVPSITTTGFTMSTGTFASYSWSTSGTPIAGANAQSYTATSNGDYTVTVTDANGCTGTSAIKSITGVGVNTISTAYGISVYPNPANDVLYISTAVPVSVSVVTVDGKLLLHTDVTAGKPSIINTSSLATGLYLLRFMDINGVLIKVEKVVKTM